MIFQNRKRRDSDDVRKQKSRTASFRLPMPITSTTSVSSHRFKATSRFNIGEDVEECLSKLALIRRGRFEVLPNCNFLKGNRQWYLQYPSNARLGQSEGEDSFREMLIAVNGSSIEMLQEMKGKLRVHEEASAMSTLNGDA